MIAEYLFVGLIVADLEAQFEGLRERGISAGEPEEIQGVGRKSVVLEPYGNALSIVKLVGETMKTKDHRFQRFGKIR